mmetsp:Transcript_14412/g.45802  ORF Transcript_14412/g.45802 Transcript_14412/m.45802 type:complete len:252 (-) Transcript_14412:1704-2459(-)
MTPPLSGARSAPPGPSRAQSARPRAPSAPPEQSAACTGAPSARRATSRSIRSSRDRPSATRAPTAPARCRVARPTARIAPAEGCFTGGMRSPGPNATRAPSGGCALAPTSRRTRTWGSGGTGRLWTEARRTLLRPRAASGSHHSTPAATPLRAPTSAQWPAPPRPPSSTCRSAARPQLGYAPPHTAGGCAQSARMGTSFSVRCARRAGSRGGFSWRGASPASCGGGSCSTAWSSTTTMPSTSSWSSCRSPP